MWPESTHDAFIWRQSAVNEKISNGTIPTVHGWPLGDSLYRLKTNLITQIPSPTTPGQRRYDRAFVKVRKTIECSFGIWKSRWRSMDKKGVSFRTVRKCCKIIMPTMVLHNICINFCLDTDIDTLDEPIHETHTPHSSRNEVLMRQEIVSTFFV